MAYPILPDTAVVGLPTCWISTGEAWMVPEGVQCVEAGLDLRFLSQHGWFRAVWVVDAPVWLLGIHRLWPGVGLIWQHVLVPDLVQAHRLTLLRLVRAEWRSIAGAEPWRWIESQILHEDIVSSRFLRWLGFQCWTTKPGYGPDGETVDVYAWRGDTPWA